MKALATHCKDLHSLVLDLAMSSVESIAQLVRNCPRLHTIQMSEAEITDDMLLALCGAAPHREGACCDVALGSFSGIWAVQLRDTIPRCPS